MSIQGCDPVKQARITLKTLECKQILDVGYKAITGAADEVIPAGINSGYVELIKGIRSDQLEDLNEAFKSDKSNETAALKQSKLDKINRYHAEATNILNAKEADILKKCGCGDRLGRPGLTVKVKFNQRGLVDDSVPRTIDLYSLGGDFSISSIASTSSTVAETEATALTVLTETELQSTFDKMKEEVDIWIDEMMLVRSSTISVHDHLILPSHVSLGFLDTLPNRVRTFKYACKYAMGAYQTGFNSLSVTWALNWTRDSIKKLINVNDEQDVLNSAIARAHKRGSASLKEADENFCATPKPGESFITVTLLEKRYERYQRRIKLALEAFLTYLKAVSHFTFTGDWLLLFKISILFLHFLFLPFSDH